MRNCCLDQIKVIHYPVQNNGGFIPRRTYLENCFLKGVGKLRHATRRNQRNRDEKEEPKMEVLITIEKTVQR